MPRRARIRLPHVPAHLLQRGVNRSPCFFSHKDHETYLAYLDELSNKFDCSIHAYVLMTNHAHLLVTPDDERGISLMMKHLGQRYVQYVNRTHKRTGGLWEGRFRSSFVDREYYLMCCYRYIEMNPVRAGLVHHPRDYVWSSYRANAEGIASTIIKPHAVFLNLAANVHERQDVYRRLFDSDLDASLVDEIRKRTNGGFAIGNELFLQQAEVACGRRVTPARRGPRPGKSGTSPNC